MEPPPTVSSAFLEMRPLWNGRSFRIFTTTWDRDRHPAASERRSEMAAVEFMRQGSYRKQVCGQSVLGDPNQVVFFNPDETFEVQHPWGRRNAGTSIRIAPETLADLLRDLDPAAADQPRRPFRATHVATAPRCHLLQQKLVSHLAREPDAEPVFVEETVLRLLRAVVCGAYRRTASRTRAADSQERGRRARVRAAREYLLAAHDQPLTLAEIAAAAGCSPWRISHLFTAEIGLPIHRYLKRLRLRHALARLADGCRDLTRLALETGFSSHSHFTSAFRREFGWTPTRWRAAACLGRPRDGSV